MTSSVQAILKTGLGGAGYVFHTQMRTMSLSGVKGSAQFTQLGSGSAGDPDLTGRKLQLFPRVAPHWLYS